MEPPGGRSNRAEDRGAPTPPDAERSPAGSDITLSGRIAVSTSETLVVTVDGAQADSVDASSRFFHVVPIELGENCFDIVATDIRGGECSNTVCLRAADKYGGFDEQTFTIDVVPDTVPPAAQIVFTPPAANISEPVQVCVQSGDNVGIATRELTADGESVNLDSVGCGSFTSDTVGLVASEATVTDPEDIAEVLATGKPRAIDLGRANDRYFCTVATVGIDAEVSSFVDTPADPDCGN